MKDFNLRKNLIGKSYLKMDLLWCITQM